MVNQGLWGAIEQYWTVEPKPRLDRRNSYFEDLKFTNNWDILRIVLVVVTLCVLLIVFWSVRWAL